MKTPINKKSIKSIITTTIIAIVSSNVLAMPQKIKLDKPASKLKVKSEERLTTDSQEGKVKHIINAQKLVFYRTLGDHNILGSRISWNRVIRLIIGLVKSEFRVNAENVITALMAELTSSKKKDSEIIEALVNKFLKQLYARDMLSFDEQKMQAWYGSIENYLTLFVWQTVAEHTSAYDPLLGTPSKDDVNNNQNAPFAAAAKKAITIFSQNAMVQAPQPEIIGVDFVSIFQTPPIYFDTIITDSWFDQWSFQNQPGYQGLGLEFNEYITFCYQIMETSFSPNQPEAAQSVSSSESAAGGQSDPSNHYEQSTYFDQVESDHTIPRVMSMLRDINSGTSAILQYSPRHSLAQYLNLSFSSYNDIPENIIIRALIILLLRSDFSDWTDTDGQKTYVTLEGLRKLFALKIYRAVWPGQSDEEKRATISFFVHYLGLNFLELLSGQIEPAELADLNHFCQIALDPPPVTSSTVNSAIGSEAIHVIIQAGATTFTLPLPQGSNHHQPTQTQLSEEVFNHTPPQGHARPPSQQFPQQPGMNPATRLMFGVGASSYQQEGLPTLDPYVDPYQGQGQGQGQGHANLEDFSVPPSAPISAGAVEHGMDTNNLTMDDLNTLSSELADIAHNFYLFGASLGIKNASLKIIKDNCRTKQIEGLREVLIGWLSMSTQHTLNAVVTSVAASMGGNNRRLAINIARKYGIKEPEYKR